MSGLNSIRLYWHAVRHLRPSQAAARLWLSLKRKVLSSRPVRPAAAAVFGRRTSILLRDDLPAPVFPPRTGLVDSGGAANFLNLRLPLTSPIDWRPPRWLTPNRLELMTLHYMEYLEALNDADFLRVVRDWAGRNRPYGNEYWMDAWNSYSVSLRCLVWMQQYARRKERIGRETGDELLVSLRRQLRFLRRNLEKDLLGNHLLKNCKTLIWAGRFFRGREADNWAAVGKKLLFRELREQVLPDGTHYERSPAYHFQVFADLLECYSVLDGSPEESRELAGILEKMARAGTALTHPDGRVSLFNDGGLNMTYRPGECREVYRRLLGPPPEIPGDMELPAAGYFGFREGGEYLLVDCGEIGPAYLPAHGHGDLLSFEWDLGGRRILIDAGVSEYRAGEARAYSRSTRAHNTLTLDDFDQCEFWGSFRAGRRAQPRRHRYSRGPEGFILEGSHDGYRRLPGRPVHTRRIERSGDRLVVEDRVEGGRGQVVKARFLCHPDNDVFLRGDLCYIVAGKVKVKMAVGAGAALEVREARYMPDFGVSLPARQIVVTYGRAPCSGRAIFEICASE